MSPRSAPPRVCGPSPAAALVHPSLAPSLAPHLTARRHRFTRAIHDLGQGGPAPQHRFARAAPAAVEVNARSRRAAPGARCCTACTTGSLCTGVCRTLECEL
ncbi:hypothetical protein AURDEDRAFT_116077 [Auricularia subglabra TFB-10046 SS5]|nr:hypothetical protein AURDEDRAFT_116077 [Auricularia subglabra TFB-10046 SS5]